MANALIFWRRPLGMAALCLAAAVCPAGEMPPPDGETVVRMEPFRTTAPPGEEQVSSGLFGPDTAVSEVPRMVTVLSSERLADGSVARVEDLSPLVPGAFNAPPYGIAGAPVIRGDLGDAAQNGQRRGFNRNVFPVSFNGIESVEVLAGAPPVLLGPVLGTGGFVNFITKRPSFERPRIVLGATAGAWHEFRGRLDATAPLTDTLAWRVSIERLERGSFYRFADERSWDHYLALAWRTARGARWDFSVEAYQAHYLENPGVNRPTQALIDRGEYITGSSVQGGGAGSYFGNTFTPAGTVRLDGAQILAAPDDGAWARMWTAQLTGAWTDAAGRELTVRTYFEHLASEKHAAYAFYSLVPRSRTLEQRIEIREGRRWGGLEHSLLWGVGLRAEERASFVDFLNEPLNAYDLTMDPDTFRIPVERLFAVRPVPGKPGRFAVSGGRYGAPASTGISQTLHSRLGGAGLFFQDRVGLSSRLALTLGLRGDAIAAQTEDPLPRPGFAPVRDGLATFLPAGSASLLWRAGARTNWYVTVSDAAAMEASSSSGGFGLTNNRLPDELFENRSRLVEAGARLDAPDGGWSAALSLYHQRRHRFNPRAGRPDEIAVRGAELSGAWRPADRLEISFNGALTEARYVDGPLPGSIATVPGFDPAIPSPNFGAFPAGDHRLPGWPRWQANFSGRWNAGRALALRTSVTLQGGQNLDLSGRVRLPPQQTWNAGITWRTGSWELRGDCFNLTDEFNWRPTSTPFAGGDLVTRELPRHWRASFQRRF